MYKWIEYCYSLYFYLLTLTEGGADGSSGGGCGTSDDNDVCIRSGDSTDTDAGTLILVLVPADNRNDVAVSIQYLTMKSIILHL